MSDPIERQAAIDAMYELMGHWFGSDSEDEKREIKRELDKLPSAKTEIIRCGECKHSEHWYRDKARCFLWHEEGIDVFEDGYCNYAEQKGEDDAEVY